MHRFRVVGIIDGSARFNEPTLFLPQGNESVVPEGWPLTLGRRGLILQLGELEASALRLGECYLCIRSAAAVATTSGSGEAAAGETVERNTVEVSHVPLSIFFLFSSFRLAACSLRAPGEQLFSIVTIIPKVPRHFSR